MQPVCGGQRSEDNVQESMLPFHLYVVPGIKLRASNLDAGALSTEPSCQLKGMFRGSVQTRTVSELSHHHRMH